MSAENTMLDAQGERQVKKANPLKNLFPVLVFVGSLVLAILIYLYVLGNPSNFQDNDPNNQPLPGNMLGTVYKGGVIIPVGLALMIIWITFMIERTITLVQASGKGSIDVFVQKIRLRLHDGDIEGAIEECDRHKSSVANVVKAGLRKYREVENETHMDKDQKKLAIQAEIEEASTLELPMLQRNLPVLATAVSIGVLVGLLGTVMGMIRAFSALSNAGAPDAGELATGISEALVNTLVGIASSALAIIFYNFFSNRVDTLTYAMDEAGFSIVQEFQATAK